MPYKNLTESPEKANLRIANYESSPASAQSFQDGLQPIPQLQRTLGNRNVAKLIQAKQLTQEGKIVGLQPKLTVGAADDQYEQEADRVARQVMSTPDAVAANSMQRAMSPEEDKDKMLQTKPLAASITPFVQRQMVNNEEPEDKEKPVQAKFLNKMSREHLQRQSETEEEKKEPIQAKSAGVQRAISSEEDKDKMLQTKPLAASITPFMQREMVNKDEPEDKEKPVQAKFSTETNREPLQRQPETEEDKKEPIQAKFAGPMSDSFEAGSNVETQVSQSKGRGSPLPDPVRAYMEPRFGVDFSDVRVHTGSDALQMNRDVGAQAFTHGSDIFFGAGRNPSNLELTAHELTHVVQQTGGTPLQPKRPDEASSTHTAPYPQRTRAAYAAGSKEEKGADFIYFQKQSSGLARKAADASPAGPDASGSMSPQAKPSRVSELAMRVRNAAGLRAMLAADPSLALEIQAYFAAGNVDSALNDLMGRAFAPPRASALEPMKSGNDVKAKNPTDPTVALPADRKDSKVLTKGEMKWTLHAVDHSRARCDVDFKPDKNKVDAKNISFVQTIIQQLGSDRIYPGGTQANPTKTKGTFQPLEDPTSKKYVDHFAQVENDPFYGAEWDQATKKWKSENGTATLAVGSSTKGASSVSATMNDTPDLGPVAREGKGDTSSEFETVPVVLETREPLGALKWGFKIKDAENAPIELTAGQAADCTDTPSASWSAALNQYYTAKYETILDEFDIAKADLKPDHKTKLDGVAAKMKAKAALKAQLGGASDLTGNEEFNKALSLKRAEAARDYLVTKGVDAGRLEVQSYSFDWARVEAEKGKSEGKNRRVQIWLR